MVEPFVQLLASEVQEQGGTLVAKNRTDECAFSSASR
jgi:hypothetical protein